MKGKIDVIRLVSIIATGLGFAGTILSGWAGDKKVDKTIEEKIVKHLGEMNK